MAPSREKEIRGHTERFRTIAELGNDGIFVLDESDRIEFANTMASIITDIPMEKLFGKDFKGLLTSEGIRFLEDLLSRSERSGAKVCTEMELVSGTGTVKDVEVCIAIPGVAAGETKRFTYVRDITERKRFEQELRDSERRYRNLFQHVQHGIFISSKEGRFLDCNPALLEMLGYCNKGEFLKIDITRDLYVNPQDRKTFQKMVERDGYVKDFEVEFKRKDGRKITILLTAHPIRNEQGEIVGYQGLNIDITERKQFERDLKTSEEKYRTLFERVRHGLFISTKEGRFLDCNQALLDILGYEDKEEFLKIDIARDLYVNPKGRRRFQKLIEREGFVKDFEVDFKRKDGQTITILLTAHVLRGLDGEVLGYEGLNIDISERKKIEGELREANDFLTNLIESSVDGIIVTDMKGDILIFNNGAERILGYQSEEVIGGMNIRELYPPGVAQEVMQKMRSPDHGGAGKLNEFRVVLRNKWGEWIDCDLSASLIYDDQGNQICSVGNFKDLRERLEMEERLQETQQQLLQSEKLAAMGRLTSQIAHELNNPIYGIMNTLELLKTEIPPESKRRKILEMSLSETQRLSEMLRNMLSFSKPEEEVHRPVDVNELLNGIVIFIDKQMRETNIDIEVRLGEEIPKVMGSTNQLRQVFLNIIRNAREAMSQGGILSLETVKENERVAIHIRDTGVGIPEEIRSKIFEAFFTTKHEVKGVGLGLSVCYGIIKDHGGEIRVESEEGKGSTFSIILPAS